MKSKNQEPFEEYIPIWASSFEEKTEKEPEPITKEEKEGWFQLLKENHSSIELTKEE